VRGVEEVLFPALAGLAPAPRATSRDDVGIGVRLRSRHADEVRGDFLHHVAPIEPIEPFTIEKLDAARHRRRPREVDPFGELPG
jgi:hypothetical protein